MNTTHKTSVQVFAGSLAEAPNPNGPEQPIKGVIESSKNVETEEVLASSEYWVIEEL